MPGKIAQTRIFKIMTKRKLISISLENNYEAFLKIEKNEATRSTIAKDFGVDAETVG